MAEAYGTIRLFLAATLILAAIAPVNQASAQTSVTVVPSVSVGTVYDDNLFARAAGDAGVMTRVRPSAEVNVETPRLTLSTLYSFDIQRSNHASLNMLNARRHGSVQGTFRTTQETTMGLGVQYDRSDTPGELNPDSGLLGDGQLRLHAGAGVEQNGQRDRQVRPAEQRHVLLRPVFEHAEILHLQVGQVARGSVDDGDVQGDHVDVGAE